VVLERVRQPGSPGQALPPHAPDLTAATEEVLR
jgi:hypothetical protein